MHVDVLIVGAGPVGCTAARLLRAEGREVLLLEKLPRATVRGPYLSGVGRPWLGLFQDLGLADLVEAHRINAGHSVHLQHARGGRLTASVPEHLARWMIARGPFDQAVRERTLAAGVPAHFEIRRLDLERLEDRVTGATWEHEGRSIRVTAELVITADGNRATLARRLGAPDQPTFRRLYQGRRFRRTDVPRGTYAFLPTRRAGVNLLVFADGDERDAYVEVEVDQDRATGLGRADRDEAFERLVDEVPAAQKLLGPSPEPLDQWSAIAIRGGRRPALIAPGAIALGDAACCPDPLGSSGLLLGLQATRDLRDALAGQPDVGIDLAPWAAAHDRRADALQRFTRLLRPVLEGRLRSRLALGWIRRSEARTRAALAGFNGEISHDDFLSPRAQLRLWTGR